MKRLLLLVIMILFISVITEACVIPKEDIRLNESTTLCQGTYYFNDTNANGALFLNHDNIILNCNNSRLVGIKFSESRAIQTNYANISILNCNISNYAYGVFITSNTDNSFFASNIFSNCRGIFGYGIKNNTINSNVFINSSIYLSSTSGYTIRNNSFICKVKCGDRSDAILLTSSENMTIQNNSITGSEFGIYAYKNNKNLLIANNTLQNHDRAIYVNSNKIKKITIINNKFINNSANFDSYLLDIHLLNSSFVDIEHNNFLQSVDSSILLTETSNISIVKNNFELICINNRQNYFGNGQNEPCSAILAKELYKTWCYGCTERSDSEIAKRASHNLNILGNTFNNETNVFLYAQGATNVKQDFTNYWYRSFEISHTSDQIELYLNKKYDQARNYARNFNNSNSRSLYEGYSLGNFTFFGIKNTSMYFRPTESVEKNISLFNLSLAKPFNDIFNFSNGKLLAANVPNYTIQIGPGQEIRVGDYTPNLTSCILPSKSWNLSTTLSNVYNLSSCFRDPMNLSMTFSAVGNISILPTINRSLVSLRATKPVTESVTFIARGMYSRNASATVSLTAIDDSKPYCGDSTCNNNETCSSCSLDCGACHVISPCTLSNVSFNQYSYKEAYNLSSCFTDTLHPLFFSVVGNSSVKVKIADGIVNLSSNEAVVEHIYFRANDTNLTATTNNVTITVNHVSVCGDSLCDGTENCNNCRTDCGVCSSGSPSGGGSSGGGPSFIPTPKNRIIEPVSGNASNVIPTVQDTHTVITNDVPTFTGISTPSITQEQPRNISSVIPQIVSSVVTLAVLTVAVVRLNLKKKQRVKAGYSQQYLEALKLREYQMFEWVQMARKRGLTDSVINQMLIKNGWNSAMVQDALRYKELAPDLLFNRKF